MRDLMWSPIPLLAPSHFATRGEIMRNRWTFVRKDQKNIASLLWSSMVMQHQPITDLNRWNREWEKGNRRNLSYCCSHFFLEEHHPVISEHTYPCVVSLQHNRSILQSNRMIESPSSLLPFEQMRRNWPSVMNVSVMISTHATKRETKYVRKNGNRVLVQFSAFFSQVRLPKRGDPDPDDKTVLHFRVVIIFCIIRMLRQFPLFLHSYVCFPCYDYASSRWWPFCLFRLPTVL